MNESIFFKNFCNFIEENNNQSSYVKLLLPPISVRFKIVDVSVTRKDGNIFFKIFFLFDIY